ncbi:crossover junction endodeoxyribonuclease RusA [Rhizobium leguminosarum]
MAEAARSRIAEIVEWTYLEPEPLSLTIFYFPIAPMGGDIDNIVKPIMDALIGILYIDDNSVERVMVQKFEPAVAWEFSQPTEHLTAALDATSASEDPTPVVYVQVANDLSWRRF